MNRKWSIFLLQPFWWAIFLPAYAQDFHLSQPLRMPVFLNPAAAGFQKRTYEFSGVYRSQWHQLTDPFRTLGTYLSTSLPAGKNKNQIIGLALSGFADKAGAVNFTTSVFALTGSFHYNFGDAFQHYIGGGFSVGSANVSLDIARITTDEFFLQGTQSEVLGFEKTSYADLSAGLVYNLLSDTTHLQMGLACLHFNKPRVAFSSHAKSEVYPKMVFTVTYAYPLLKGIDFTPSVAAFFQGPAQELLVGFRLDYELPTLLAGDYGLAAALYLRYGDALIPAIALVMDDLHVGLSYDLNIGTLADAPSRLGALELTLTYRGTVRGISSGRVYNPRF
ncbi:MAG: PorP/SprF family type IX secretion system membrane protein [Chitinophagales bacterium]|nr:PorP/SprF family type IX secretion system membrane protein [Chitinophagales bacterium]MDW8427412.1 PorP/SprF family type IX secretion system membrane protein [Chitinophagales bacterium]